MKTATVALLVGIFSVLCFPVSAQVADHDGLCRIGWAQADITPAQPVIIIGSSPRVSEGVLDFITATALVVESQADDGSPVQIVMVSCDLVEISDSLRDAVREKLKKHLPELNPQSVFIGAIHSHATPDNMPNGNSFPYYYLETVEPVENAYGVELPVMSAREYVEFASDRIAAAVVDAWQSRKPGGIAYGQGYVVVGHNRLATFADGTSEMLGKACRADFSHIEGYEDHTVNILATYSADCQEMTGIIINIAAPSQVMRGYLISADFWHETREKLRRRLGSKLFILPQLSAAGDQNWMPLVERPAYERMGRLAGRVSSEELADRIANSAGRDLTREERIARVENALECILPQRGWRSDPSLDPVSRRIADEVNRFLIRDELAERIAEAVSRTLPLIKKEIDWNPACRHRVETVGLPRRIISEEYVKKTEEQSEKAEKRYRELLSQLEETPQARQQNLWYRDVTREYEATQKGRLTRKRFLEQQNNPDIPVELHAVRLGDVGFVTNPFELYLDFGMRIKARSPAMQTFVVQLVGTGTYLPTARAVAGGAYGAQEEQNAVGPEGGRELVEWSVSTLQELWKP